MATKSLSFPYVLDGCDVFIVDLFVSFSPPQKGRQSRFVSFSRVMEIWYLNITNDATYLWFYVVVEVGGQMRRILSYLDEVLLSLVFVY